MVTGWSARARREWEGRRLERILEGRPLGGQLTTPRGSPPPAPTRPGVGLGVEPGWTPGIGAGRDSGSVRGPSRGRRDHRREHLNGVSPTRRAHRRADPEVNRGAASPSMRRGARGRRAWRRALGESGTRSAGAGVRPAAPRVGGEVLGARSPVEGGPPSYPARACEGAPRHARSARQPRSDPRDSPGGVDGPSCRASWRP